MTESGTVTKIDVAGGHFSVNEGSELTEHVNLTGVEKITAGSVFLPEGVSERYLIIGEKAYQGFEDGDNYNFSTPNPSDYEEYTRCTSTSPTGLFATFTGTGNTFWRMFESNSNDVTEDCIYIIGTGSHSDTVSISNVDSTGFSETKTGAIEISGVVATISVDMYKVDESENATSVVDSCFDTTMDTHNISLSWDVDLKGFVLDDTDYLRVEESLNNAYGVTFAVGENNPQGTTHVHLNGSTVDYVKYVLTSPDDGLEITVSTNNLPDGILVEGEDDEIQKIMSFDVSDLSSFKLDLGNLGGNVSDTYYIQNSELPASFNINKNKTDGKIFIANPLNITTMAPPVITSPIDVENDLITVRWDAVSEATGYTCQYKESGDETWTTVTNVTLPEGENTVVTATVNVSEAGTYYFQVQAYSTDPIIESPWSEIETVTTTAESGTQLSTPTGFTATPQEERVLLSWTAVEGNTYTVNYKLASGTEWTSFTGTTTGGTATVSGLTAEKPYDFQIQAKKGTDTSGYATISATPDTALATPTITVSNITANSVTVSWTADSAPVPTYVLKYSTDSGVTWTPVEGATNGGTINDLDSNTSYMFSVTAETTGYTTQVATETKLTLPAAPTGLTAAANGDDWVTVSWTAPTGNGTITGYTLEYSAGDSEEWTDTTFTGTGTSYVHKGLEPVTTYHYRVKSTNASGSSAYTSENVIATTKAALATPTITVATAVSSSSVTVNWNVTGETETGASYEVQYSSNNWTNTLSVSATPGSTTVTGLEPDTPYVFRVVAKAEGYDSQTSSEVTAKTYNAPVTVGGLTFTPGADDSGNNATVSVSGNTVTITGPVTVAETSTGSYTGGVSVIKGTGADLDGTLSLNGTETFKVGDTTYTNVSGTTNLTITDSNPSVTYDEAYSVATSDGTTTYSKVAQTVGGLTFTPPISGGTNPEITIDDTTDPDTVTVTSDAWTVANTDSNTPGESITIGVSGTGTIDGTGCTLETGEKVNGTSALTDMGFNVSSSGTVVTITPTSGTYGTDTNFTVVTGSYTTGGNTYKGADTYVADKGSTVSISGTNVTTSGAGTMAITSGSGAVANGAYTLDEDDSVTHNGITYTATAEGAKVTFNDGTATVAGNFNISGTPTADTTISGTGSLSGDVNLSTGASINGYKTVSDDIGEKSGTLAFTGSTTGAPSGVYTTNGTTIYVTDTANYTLNGLTFTPVANSETPGTDSIIEISGTTVDVTSGTCDVKGTATGAVTMVGTGFNTAVGTPITVNDGENIKVTSGSVDYTAQDTGAELTIADGVPTITEGTFDVNGAGTVTVNGGTANVKTGDSVTKIIVTSGSATVSGKVTGSLTGDGTVTVGGAVFTPGDKAVKVETEGEVDLNGSDKVSITDGTLATTGNGTVALKSGAAITNNNMTFTAGTDGSVKIASTGITTTGTVAITYTKNGTYYLAADSSLSYCGYTFTAGDGGAIFETSGTNAISISGAATVTDDPTANDVVAIAVTSGTTTITDAITEDGSSIETSGTDSVVAINANITGALTVTSGTAFIGTGVTVDSVSGSGNIYIGTDNSGNKVTVTTGSVKIASSVITLADDNDDGVNDVVTTSANVSVTGTGTINGVGINTTSTITSATSTGALTNVSGNLEITSGRASVTAATGETATVTKSTSDGTVTFAGGNITLGSDSNSVIVTGATTTVTDNGTFSVSGGNGVIVNTSGEITDLESGETVSIHAGTGTLSFKDENKATDTAGDGQITFGSTTIKVLANAGNALLIKDASTATMSGTTDSIELCSGSLTLSGGSGQVTSVSSTISFTSAASGVTITGGAITGFGVSQAAITAGTFTIAGASGGTLSVGDGSATYAGGTFEVTSGSVLLNNTTPDSVGLNGGAISVSSGTLATTGNGTVTVANDKALTSGGSTFTSNADGSKLQINGTAYEVTAGSFTITGTGAGTYTLTAGSTLSYCGYTFTAGEGGAIFETSGTNAISISGAATVTDDTEVTNVAVAITVTSGTTAINTPISVPVSSITTSDTGAVTANNTATIAGNVTIGGSGNSTFDAAITGDVSISNGTNDFNGAITGNVTITGASTNDFAAITGDVEIKTNASNNDFDGAITGSVVASAGTSTFSAGVTDNGTDPVEEITISADANVTFDGGNYVATIVEGGELNISTSGTIASLDINGGTTSYTAGAITGDFTVGGGASLNVNTDYTGTVKADGKANVAIAENKVLTRLEVTNTGAVTISGDGEVTTATVAGTAIESEQGSITSNTWTVKADKAPNATGTCAISAGDLTSVSAGTVVFEGSDTFDLTGGAKVNYGTGNINSVTNVSGTNALTFDGSGLTTIDGGTVTVTATDTFDVTDATVQIGGGTQSMTAASGTTVTLDAASGLISGLGDGETVTINDGEFSLTKTTSTSAKVNVTNGDTLKYVGTDGTTYTAKAGSSYATFDTDGNIILNGTFEVTEAGTYNLAANSVLIFNGYIFTADADGAQITTAIAADENPASAEIVSGNVTITDAYPTVDNLAMNLTVTAGNTALNTNLPGDVTINSDGKFTTNAAGDITGDVIIAGGTNDFNAAINGTVTIIGGTTNNFTSAGAVTISGGSATNTFTGDVASVTVNTITVEGVTTTNETKNSFTAAVTGNVNISSGTKNDFTSTGAVTISGGSAKNTFTGDVASVTVSGATNTTTNDFKGNVTGAVNISSGTSTTIGDATTDTVGGNVTISGGATNTINSAVGTTATPSVVSISGGTTNDFNGAITGAVTITGGNNNDFAAITGDVEIKTNASNNDFDGAITGSVTASAGTSTFSAGVTGTGSTIAISGSADVTFDGGDYVATIVEGGELNIGWMNGTTVTSMGGTIASLDLNGGTTNYYGGTITNTITLDDATLNVYADLANTVDIDANTDKTANIVFQESCTINAVVASTGTVEVTEAEGKNGTIGSYTNNGAKSTVAAAITGTADTTVVTVSSGSATFNDAITGNVSVSGSGNITTSADGDITGTLSISTTSADTNTLAGDVSGKVSISAGTNTFNGALTSTSEDIDLDIDGGTNMFTAAVAGDVGISGDTSNTFATGATVSGKVSISAGTNTFNGALTSSDQSIDLDIDGGTNMFTAAVAGDVDISNGKNTFNGAIGTTTTPVTVTISGGNATGDYNNFSAAITGAVTITGGNNNDFAAITGNVEIKTNASNNDFDGAITGSVAASAGKSTFSAGVADNGTDPVEKIAISGTADVTFDGGDYVATTVDGGTLNIGTGTNNPDTIASLDINGGTVNYYGSGEIGGNVATNFTLSTGTMNLYGNLTDSLTLDSEGKINYNNQSGTLVNTITNVSGTNTLTFDGSYLLTTINGGEVTFVGSDTFDLTDAAKVNYGTNNSVTNVTGKNSLEFEGSDLKHVTNGTVTVTATDEEFDVTDATVQITDTSKSVTVAGTVTLNAKTSSITKLGTGETVTINAGAFNVATTAGEDGKVVVKNNTTAPASAILDLQNALTATVPGGDMTFTFSSSANTITLTEDSTVTADMTIPAGVELITGEHTLTAPDGVTISVNGAITTASPVQLITTGTGKFVFEAGDDSKLIINQTEYIGKEGAIVITAGTLDVQTSAGGGFSATLSGTSPAVTIQKGNGLMFGAGLDANIFYMGANDKLDVTAGTLNIETPVDCTGTIVSTSENIELKGDNSYLIYNNDELQDYFKNPELTLIERSTDGRVGYYPDLQIALNNANSVEDVIMLTCDINMLGGYESLIVTKSITIDGEKEDKSNYTITGNGTQPIFDVDANGLELRLQYLNLTNSKSHDVGGGIRNTTNSSLTLTSVMFENCFAPLAGGAIYSEGNVTISGTSTFSGNSSARGGAIYLEKGATIKIDGVTTATSALYTDNGYLKQYPVVFTGNEATSYCAGIYASGNVNITGTSFTENKGSAVYITSSGTTNTFTSTDFVANTNTALVIQNGTVTLKGAVVFAGNTGNKGGAIYLAGGTLESGTTATASTHALYKLDTVTGVKPNTTRYAAQFFGNEGTYGGAINASGTANLSNMYFERNQAVYGGAVYGNTVNNVSGTTMTMNYASFHGGAIYNTGTEIAATNAVIKNNWAGVNYGAVYGAVSGLSTTNPNFVVNAGHAKGIVNNSVANNAGLMAMPAGGEGTAESEMYKMYKYSSLIITDTNNANYVSDSDIAETNAANASRAFNYLTINTGTDGLKVDTVTTGMSTVYLSTDYEQYVSPKGYDDLSTLAKEVDYNWLIQKSNWEFKPSTLGDTSIVQPMYSDKASETAACDFDDSGKVDMVDFVDFAQSFNSTDSAKDFDGNGKVDMADFIHFAQQFNKQVLDLAQESAQEMLAMKAAELPEVPTAQPVVVVEAAPVVEAIPAAQPEAAPVVIDAPKAAAAKPAENFWDSYDALGDSIETPVVTPVSEDGSLFDEEPVELFESEDAEALDTEL